MTDAHHAGHDWAYACGRAGDMLTRGSLHRCVGTYVLAVPATELAVMVAQTYHKCVDSIR